MELIVHRMYGGWRWLLRDGVDVIARGPVQIGKEGERLAVKGAQEFRAAVAVATVETVLP